MSHDEFTKLYVFMNERFDAIDAELAKKADTDEMYKRFDALAAAMMTWIQNSAPSQNS